MKRSWAELEPRSIAKAIKRWHELGGEEFIDQTRFKDSYRYVVMDKGQRIASKPLLAMAFQLQFGCDKDGPPRLSEGEQTRAILKRLGYTLVDLHDETLEDPGSRARIAVGSSMKFWWADQSKSFDMVFEDGTLWAARSGRRGAQLDYWRNLNSASPGDIVFHYVGPHVRAVSRVATMPRPAYPPRGYDVHPGTKGALVLTEPVCEVQIPRETVLAVLEDGYGPVNADGTLRRGYFFPLVPDQALALMRWAGLENVDEPDPGAEAFDQYLGGASDRLAVTAVRAEQRFLRDQQVRRWGSSCCLCGGSLSEELLVAAHIKPRWACSETERMDTGNVAMLACLFGCDALYELGYIVVDDQGRIGRGRPGSARVESRLQDLVGRRCPAYGEESGRYFAWHRQHHLDNQAEQS